MKVDCRECHTETNHTVLFKKVVADKKNGQPTSLFKQWYMVTQCAGCDSHHFVLRTIIPKDDSTDQNHYDDVYPIYENPNVFMKEEQQDQLPSPIYDLYEEVQAAFFSDSQVLAGIGLRKLVEVICIHQNIQGANLRDKINNLHSEGLVSKMELPLLHTLREIGNISAHDVKGLSMDKLYYALEIINHVLTSIYILPKINKRLKVIPLSTKQPKKNAISTPSTK